MTVIKSAFGNNPVGAAGGDLSGTYPNPSVAKINGVTVSGTAAINDTLVASSSSAAAWQLGLVQQATTTITGYTLVNGTGNIITWTTPNDGLIHRALVFLSKHVTSTETGGQIQVTWTSPDSSAGSVTQYAGGQGSGLQGPNNAGLNFLMLGPNTTVTVRQSSALTGGASLLFTEIWGS